MEHTVRLRPLAPEEELLAPTALSVRAELERSRESHPRNLRELTEGIRSGNEAAFNEFYDRYADRLYRYLRALEPADESLIREAMQDTMIRVLRYVKPIEEEEILWGWLTRVARTARIDLCQAR